MSDADSCKIHALIADITRLDVDAIVNAANEPIGIVDSQDLTRLKIL